MTTTVLRVALALSVAVTTVGCGDDGDAGTSPTSAGEGEGEGQEAPPPDDDVPDIPAPDPNDPIDREMGVRATQFAEGMRPATPIFRGTLETGQNQDYQAILQSDRCFKIVGVGGSTVTDLDLFLFDPNGVQLQQDTATDAYPVLGLTHPICPDLAGSYRVQVRMYEGSGDYGVQVFYDERI